VQHLNVFTPRSSNSKSTVNMNTIPYIARFDAWTRALSAASRGLPVLYVTNERYAQDTLLPSVNESDSAALDRISFKFFSSTDEVKRFLCYAHVLFGSQPTSVPRVIFIDIDQPDSVCSALLENLVECLDPPPECHIARD
jgi:hypothetical protein